MRVTAVETIRNTRWSNFLWVRVETDEGVTGLGETFRHPVPIASYVHDVIAPYLLGRDPTAINAIAHDLAKTGGMRFNAYPTRSVEVRANSAVDIALWDLRAKALGLPLSALLGGPVREAIPVYNTCAGPGYNWQARSGADLIPGTRAAGAAPEVPDDLAAQAERPGELAEELLAEGIRAMKIWPFDAAAHATGGRLIEPGALRAALDVLEAIRAAVGDRIEILLEYHGLWHQAPARRILAAADAYRPFWHEDPVAMEHVTALAELRRGSATPIAGSESHGTAVWFRDALAAGAVDYMHFDIAWVGGLSEGVRIAHLAQAHDRLIAPHDCTGPVTWIANLHLALAMPNTLWLESVRAYHKGVYREMVTALPRIADGLAQPMGGTGLGTELSPALLAHPDTEIRRATP